MSKQKDKRAGKLHYAWIIFCVCTISFISTVGVQLSTQGLFYQPVSKELGISVGTFTLAGIFTGAGNALAQTFSARTLQRFSVRAVYGAALGIYGLLYFSMGFFTRIWMWYAASFVMGLCTGFAGIPLLAYLMNRWFAKKRSTLLGLCTAISSFVIIFATMLASAIIEKHGWRMCYTVFGLFILLVGAPFVAFFVRRDPQEMGLRPYGETEVQGAPEKHIHYEVKVKLLPGEKPLFVCLLVLVMCMCFPQSFVAHLASYGASIGFSATAGATLISFANAGNLLAKLVISPLNERFGARRMTLLVIVLLMISMLLLMFGTKVRALVTVGAAICGMALMIGTVQIPVVVWDMFDSERYTPIYNTLSIGTMVVSMLSGSFVGMVYSANDSYLPCMAIALGVLTVCAILLPVVYHLRKKIPAAASDADVPSA